MKEKKISKTSLTVASLIINYTHVLLNQNKITVSMFRIILDMSEPVKKNTTHGYESSKQIFSACSQECAIFFFFLFLFTRAHYISHSFVRR